MKMSLGRLLISQELPDPIKVQDMELEEFIFWGIGEVTVGFGITSASLIYENKSWRIICGGF